MSGRAVYAKGIAKREAILSAALDVVATHGYRRASVREIADAVGLSPAGLLHYFDSKEELFTAILRARDERDGLMFDSAGGRSFTADDGAGVRPEKAIETFLAVLRHNAAVPGLVQLYAQLSAEVADPDHPARAYFLERTEHAERIAVLWVSRAQEEGLFRADLDPAWIVRTLHALADGLQPLWLLDPELDMAAHVGQFIELLKPVPPAPER